MPLPPGRMESYSKNCRKATFIIWRPSSKHSLQCSCFNPPPPVLYLSQNLFSHQHTFPIELLGVFFFFLYVETSEVPFLFSLLSRKEKRATFLFPTMGYYICLESLIIFRTWFWLFLKQTWMNQSLVRHEIELLPSNKYILRDMKEIVK